ncbi:Uncharacterized protein APZ42_002827, partial [Daphnia magna]
VQPTGKAIEDIGVVLGVDAADQVDDAAACSQSLDRILLRVGVEVTEQDHVLRAGRSLYLADEDLETLRLLLAGGVVAALQIALVGVRARGTAAALGLQVVDQHRKTFAIGGAEA